MYPRGFWKAKLPANTTPTPDSPAQVAQIAAANHGCATKQWSSPIFRVGLTVPLKPIIIDGPSASAPFKRVLEAAMNVEGGVPFPNGAQPSPDTDAHIGISQTAWNANDGREWEFWRASSPEQNAPGAGPLPWGEASHGDSTWHAWWGGRISHCSTNRGAPVNRKYTGGLPAAQANVDYEEEGWLGVATHVSHLGGLITIAEVQAGSIPHVIGLALPNTLTTPAWIPPALGADGISGTIPPGSFLRLPPGYAVDPALPSLMRMIVTAVRDYGFLLWDSATGTQWRHEISHGSVDDWPALFTDQSGAVVQNYAMAGLFPWADLQVIDRSAAMRASYGYA